MIERLKRIRSWLKISFTWLFCGGRSYTRLSFQSCESLESLDKERDRINSHIKSFPNHWVYRDFQNIYHERKMELFYGW